MRGSGLVEAVFQCSGRRDLMCGSFPMISIIMEIEKGGPLGSKALLSLFQAEVQEERLEGRVHQPAQLNWKRPGHDDRGYGGDMQGGYEGDQYGEE
jgi:hypothetical protein